MDNHYTEGLVDSESPDEFDDNLQKFRYVWDKREMLARDTTVPAFFQWFKMYHSDLVKEKMLKPVRCKAGLVIHQVNIPQILMSQSIVE